MGCKIKTNQRGKLAFRLFWEKIPGGRSWEGTGLDDTPAHRELLEAKAKVIAAEMKEGTFNYLRWFPRGNKAHLFANLAPKDPTVREYYDAASFFAEDCGDRDGPLKVGPKRLRRSRIFLLSTGQSYRNMG